MVISANPWTSFTGSEAPRIYVFVGAYGSGKSEVSVNFACLLRRLCPERKILLADMDIVNPFFRSADANKVLEKENIRLIAPNYANTNVDVPSVSGEVFSVFDDEDTMAVLDIGGEDLGARILSSMHTRFSSVSYRVFMVVNTLRPFTSDAPKIAQMARELSLASRLPITGLVDNSNLLEETTPDEILLSSSIVKEASELLSVPISFACGMHRNFPLSWNETTPSGLPFLRMRRTIQYDYGDGEKE